MKGKPRLLVVDDEQNIRKILQVAFDRVGYHVGVVEDGKKALDLLESEPYDAVLTDVTMPGISGYELLREVKSRWPDMPVIIMTAFGTIPQAVQAIRDGAHEYVTKPFDLEQLKRVVASAFSLPKAKCFGPKPGAKAALIAESPAMKEILETIAQVADSRATVMIGGESGVGKEVLAKALHAMSSRSNAKFVALSCAALPETLLESELFGYEKGAFTGAQSARAGRFETADGGTLFLDEIGEVPMSFQVKLLRVLQEREFERLGSSKPTKVDVRVVTASHRDLREAVELGTFRLDLLYRLQVVEIYVPPLRERIPDILPLAEHFLGKYAVDNERSPLSISEGAAQMLMSYRWPGNVRELENTMERATVLAPATQGELTARLLPASFARAA